MVVFKLKTAIYVDELFHRRNFEFCRISTRKGRSHTDVIGCLIRGLREASASAMDATTSGSENGFQDVQDDGTRELKIHGCEYRVTKKSLEDFLG